MDSGSRNTLVEFLKQGEIGEDELGNPIYGETMFLRAWAGGAGDPRDGELRERAREFEEGGQRFAQATFVLNFDYYEVFGIDATMKVRFEDEQRVFRITKILPGFSFRRDTIVEIIDDTGGLSGQTGAEAP